MTRLDEREHAQLHSATDFLYLTFTREEWTAVKCALEEWIPAQTACYSINHPYTDAAFRVLNHMNCADAGLVDAIGHIGSTAHVDSASASRVPRWPMGPLLVLGGLTLATLAWLGWMCVRELVGR